MFGTHILVVPKRIIVQSWFGTAYECEQKIVWEASREGNTDHIIAETKYVIELVYSKTVTVHEIAKIVKKWCMILGQHVSA